MKELKKGAQPTKENTQTQAHSITLDAICIVNLLLSFVLMVVGKCTGNLAVKMLGAGIALVALEIALYRNRGEGNE